MTRKSILLVALALAATVVHADPIKRAQFPCLSPDGATVVFSWQGDLWKVGVAGGRAERLTVHPANDTSPRWTPDGSKIVFSSNRFGNYDLFSMSPDGTNLVRLTFESGAEYPNSFSPDGKFVYGYTNSFSRTDLFRVAVNGGEMERMTDHPLETEYYATVSPDGKQVYYNRGSYGPRSWVKPGVTGTAVGDIWVADNTVPLTNHRNLTSSDAAELYPMVASDGTMYYVSNRSGWPNIWKNLGKGAKQLTQHMDGTLRNPSLSGNGKTMVYEFESELYTLDLATNKSQKLEVDVPADQRLNPNAELTLTAGLSEYAVSPDGKRSVIGVRGELFLIPERGGTTRRLTNNVALDGNAVWLDPKTILYVAAAADSKRELKTVTIDGVVKPFLSDAEDLQHPSISPDGKWVAYHRGITEIMVVPVSGAGPKKISTGNFADSLAGEPAFAWSPDSKWLLVDEPTDRGSNVVMRSIDLARSVVVARTARGVASTPQFLPNGKSVYFTAQEFENPDLFVVDLVPPDTNFTEDDLDKIDSPKSAKSEITVEVYEPWIERRMRRLTQNGAVGAWAAADSRSIYTNIDGQLSTVSVTNGSANPVAGVTGPAGAVSMGAGGAKVYFVQAGKLFALAAGAPAPSPVSFSAQMSVNLKAEEMALFSEVWWAMDRQYYDTTFHGKDWKAIRAKFAKIVPFCYDRSDFYNLMGEMMEELDSSHLGSTAPVVEPFGTDSTASLGVEFDPSAIDQRGVYVVKRVLDGSAGSLPQSRLLVGDRIVSIDGEEPGAKAPIATLLNKKAGRKVKLSIDRGGKTIEMLIKPDSAASRTPLEYENWVAWQRAQVDKLSQGQFAYFHIQAMDDASFQRMLREIRTMTPGKKGAIIDVRYNGGGSTSHKVLGVLIKTPWLIRTTRGPEGIRQSENIYRGDSLEIPTALMMNSASFSNAEIMGEGFRKLGRGPIIGERTPGYVIGTGAYGLWDGGMIRMPAIGCYAIDGEALENNGRRPDFNVPFDPNAWMQGRDPQLERAVEELLKRVK